MVLQLGRHETELNQIDSAFVAAVKSGTGPPSPNLIFGALAEASLVCAEVTDAYGQRPLPTDVRIGIARLHCAITGLAASLKIYAVLSVVGRETSRDPLRTRPSLAPSIRLIKGTP